MCIRDSLWSVILCLFSCAVIGFGVFLQVKADAVLLAAEGMSLAFEMCIRDRYHSWRLAATPWPE